jgi:hypothetical protein
MTRVYISEDCGNSPKNIFVQELTIAFAKCNSKFILNSVTDDVTLTMVGDTQIQGKENLANMLRRMKKDAKLRIDHVVTHGMAGAVNGMRTLTHGTTLAFCNVYEFSNAKGSLVRAITSYAIEVE